MPFSSFIFAFLLQYIYSYNHSLITFAEALLHIFIAADSVGWTSLGCRAEIRTRANSWNIPYPFSHSPLFFIPISYFLNYSLPAECWISFWWLIKDRLSGKRGGERGEWGGLVWHLPELYCSGVYHIVIITPLWGEHKTERTLLHIESSRNL